MSQEKIDENIASLLSNARIYSESEPVYSLLLCRKATEAFLMKKHLGILKKGTAKEILTLGDATNNKLGLKEVLTPLQLMSIQYIQNATNSFVHYRIDELEVPTKLVSRVLEEIYSLIGKHDDMKTTLKTSNWKVVLSREINNYNWPDNLNGTLFQRSWLENHARFNQSEINAYRNKLGEFRERKNRYEKMSVAEMKDELREKKLKVSGNKKELISRLKNEFNKNAKAEYRSISSRLSTAQNRVNQYEDLLKLDDIELLEMLKNATESGLISLYTDSGGKWKVGNQLGEKRMRIFYQGVCSQLPIKIKYKVFKKKWSFFFKQGKIKGRWKFFTSVNDS